MEIFYLKYGDFSYEDLFIGDFSFENGDLFIIKK